MKSNNNELKSWIKNSYTLTDIAKANNISKQSLNQKLKSIYKKLKELTRLLGKTNPNHSDYFEIPINVDINDKTVIHVIKIKIEK